jgi:myo-inositol-1(or 4)-monophosphatase
MGDAIQELRETASFVARQAGHLLKEHFNDPRKIAFKSGIDLVTDADTLSEALVLAALSKRHPTHAILSEEAGLAHEGTDTLRWVVDPLDGTTNYAHRLPHFCVSIAVERKGEVLAGAVYDPMRDELFSAGRGAGATLNGTPCQPSGATELLRALLCTGFPYDVRENPKGPVGLLARLLTKVQGIRRLGSAALDLAYVACGRLDGYFEFGLKPWDVASGALLVQEAGGTLLALDGSPWRLPGGDVLASAPGIGAALAAECRAALEELHGGS